MYYRARLLVGMLLMVVTLLSVHMLVISLQDSVSRFVVIESAIYIVPLNFFLLGLLWCTKNTTKLELIVQIYLFVVYSATVGTVYLYGGPGESPVLPMLVVPVIMGFCLGGQRVGMLWGIIIFVSLYTFFAMLKMGYQFPRLNEAEVPAELRLLNWTMAFVITIGIVMVYEMINQRLRSDLRQEREHLRQIATHDTLTGVANRVKFKERLSQLCDDCTKHNTGHVALIYLDLDGFKPVNDNYGHAAGDFVLSTVAQRLEHHTRKDDMVARMGGDEFAVILSYNGSDFDLAGIAEKLHSVIKTPIVGLPEPLLLSASIGVAIFPEHADNPEQLVHIADEAMYKAKRSQSGWRLQEVG